jgi:glycosyltransferase involved in cell wall biosynthesis
VLKLTTRLFYPLADARVAVSSGAASDLSKLSGISLDRFTVIHNPVELPSVIQSSPEAEALWGSGRPRILTVGKLKEEKNQELLIRAFARLGEPAARLVIAGDGPLLDRLQSAAKELGVADRVVFPGYVSDPWPLYAAADLFVLPSREESFGNVLVEALHAGLPIVSTRTTGAAEVLDGGRLGRLVERDDPDALAAAIERALALPHNRLALAARAEKLAGESSIAAYHRLLFGHSDDG